MIKNLQILRAVASLLVVIFHNQFISYNFGLFGVDIFFVISGYIVTNVIYRNSKKFFLKRLIRIIPSYYFFTLILIIYSLLSGLNSAIIINSETITKTLLFIPYLIDNSGPILSNGWTLNYEMFFYSIISISILYFQKPLSIILSTILILLLLYFSSSLINSDNESMFIIKYYSNSMILEFIMGISLYYILKNKITLKIYLSNKSFFLFILILLTLFMIILDINKYHQNRLILYGIPSTFLVGYVIISDSLTKTNKFSSFWVRLGNASYIMYLLHPFILKLFHNYLFKHINILFDHIFLIFVLCFISYISILIHEKYEQKLIEYLNRKIC